MDRFAMKAVAVSAAVVLLLGACQAARPPVNDRAGGVGEPVVLQLGTAEFSSSRSADSMETFKREVEARSGGVITIEPMYNASTGDGDRWDQTVAESLRDGGLDLAQVPARAFDELGVTSLQALQAPFLLTDDALVDEVVTGDLVPGLMSGLPAIGLTGLALWPDSLRHPVSFSGPIASLADLQDLTIRTPLSRASFDLLRALGAVPVDLNDVDFDAGIEDGSVTAMETTIGAAVDQRRTTVVTANITFFPKVNVLAANASVYERLSEEQRGWLRDAAAATTADLVASRSRESDAIAELCAGGGNLVIADPADVAAIEAAAATVYEELESEPLTRDLIEDLRALRDAAPTPALALEPCGSLVADPSALPVAPSPIPSPQPSGDPMSGDQSVIDGIYRYEVSEEYLLDRGFEAHHAREESGVHTFTAAGGVFSDAWVNPVESSSCEGTYSIADHLVTFRWTRGCIGDLSAVYELVDRDILWSGVIALPPHTTAYDQLVAEAFQSVPYVRIGDAPAPSIEPTPSGDPMSGDQSVLDGIYRYEVTEAYLLERGIGAAQARTESGVHTFTMAGGAFSDAWANAVHTETCTGTYSVDGTLVTFRWTGPCVGDMSARYQLVDGAIIWSDVLALPPNDAAENQMLVEAFQSVPYVRIGDAPAPSIAPTSSGDPQSGDQSVLNGVYRYEVTEAYLLEQGLYADQARDESGVQQITMRDGAFDYAWTNALGTSSCSGTYAIDGAVVTFRWTRRCTGDWRALGERDGDTIRWARPEALPPHALPDDQTIVDAFYSRPWTRISDLP